MFFRELISTIFAFEALSLMMMTILHGLFTSTLYALHNALPFLIHSAHVRSTVLIHKKEIERYMLSIFTSHHEQVPEGVVEPTRRLRGILRPHLDLHTLVYKDALPFHQVLLLIISVVRGLDCIYNYHLDLE